MKIDKMKLDSVLEAQFLNNPIEALKKLAKYDQQQLREGHLVFVSNILLYLNHKTGGGILEELLSSQYTDVLTAEDLLDILILLKYFKPDILKKTNNNGDTPLFKAVEENDEVSAAILLEQGADVNHINNKGESPLCVALGSRDGVLCDEEGYENECSDDIIMSLIQNCADISHAIKFDNSQGLNGILKEELGCVMYSRNNLTTAVCTIFLRYSPKILDSLKGQSLTHARSLLYTLRDEVNQVLELAKIYGEREVELIKDRESVISYLSNLIGVCQNVCDNSNTFHFFAKITPYDAKSEEMLKCAINLLVKAGVDINQAESLNGNAPIHIAMQLKNYGYVEMLVNAGADVNKKNEFGETPTHIVAKACNNFEHIILLQKYGAKLNELDNKGKTPMDYLYGNPELRRLGESYGMKRKVDLQNSANTFSQNKQANNYSVKSGVNMSFEAGLINGAGGDKEL